MSHRQTGRRVALLLGAAVALAACGGPTASPGAGTAPPSSDDPSVTPLSGEVAIDGSSTVYPITEAVAEEFQKANPSVRVTVAFSGTGGGFKKFCNGETDLNDASRPIKDEESATCAGKGIEPLELGVATDGLSVLVNPTNTWATCLTTAELRAIWDQGSTVATWSDIRPEWPGEPINLYGPGADSGTFDYFTEAINGTAKQSRADYVQSEDDNALVTGVAGDRYALGYFGYAYYEENQDKVKLVAIDGGGGCVTPTAETINDGSYRPLSRPLFIYPSVEALQRSEVAAFVQYYLDNVDVFVREVGYIEAHADVLAASRAALAAALR